MRVVLLSFLVVILFSTCMENNLLVDFDRDTFDRERAAWEALSMTDYAVTEDFEMSSAAPGVMARITVRGGIIADKENLTEWELEQPESIGVNGPLAFSRVKTVPEIYDWILQECEEFSTYATGSRRLSIEVSYDKTYHFPVSVDTNVSSTLGYSLEGGWFGMNLSDFTLLETEGD